MSCGRNSVNNFYSKLRNLCHKHLQNNPIELGGEGRIVNIDESLFRHKLKYHRGRATTNEIWVFGICDISFVPAKGIRILVKYGKADTPFL